MSGFVANLLQPGGGVALIPFIRYVIFALLCLTLTGFGLGVARIHMAVLSFLCAGLLVSLSVFQTEWDKLQKARAGEKTTSSEGNSQGTKSMEKTD
mmetsp:Transcript_18683/g.27050  ORF Transcript_18683/g.27050 Transcript_18683/m.27050 type:complete len:96 (+) Transcript_18683:62-349(+)